MYLPKSINKLSYSSAKSKGFKLWYGSVYFGFVWFGLGLIRLHSKFHGPRSSGKYFPGWVVVILGHKANLRKPFKDSKPVLYGKPSHGGGGMGSLILTGFSQLEFENYGFLGRVSK